MKAVPILAALVTLGSSSAAERPVHDVLMDEIERQVRLPAGARPLHEYGRYYAFEASDRVKAVYLLPDEPAGLLPAEWACEQVVALGNGSTTRAIPCPPEPATSLSLEAGARRWLADSEALPIVFDGGCTIVHLAYDLETGKIEHVFCNGSV
jgi:hypothetical protein